MKTMKKYLPATFVVLIKSDDVMSHSECWASCQPSLVVLNIK